MSRTIRRTKFNKKNRFFHHYWEAYSDKEIIEKDYIELWQYHSDNYYTKSCKNAKQFLKNLSYRKIRREFKVEMSHCFDFEDFYLNHKKAKSIKWDLH